MVKKMRHISGTFSRVDVLEIFLNIISGQKAPENMARLACPKKPPGAKWRLVWEQL